LHEESLALRRELGDKRGIAASLNNLGLVMQERGDYDESRALHEESLVLRREFGDTLGIASSLGNLGLVAQGRGDYDSARDLYQESLTIRRELGDKAGMAELFNHLGSVAQKQGDYDAAHDLYEQGLALSKELGYTWSTALLLSNLGLVAQERGYYDASDSLHKESLVLRGELGDKIGIAVSLTCLGALVVRRAGRELEARTKVGFPAKTMEPQEPVGQLESLRASDALERAATLFGAVDRLLESTPSVLTVDDRQLYEQNLEAVRSLLNAEAFGRAWELGRAMRLDQAIAYGLEAPRRVANNSPGV
jgi:tetratricopeptide (TPR) repeat protein